MWLYHTVQYFTVRTLTCRVPKPYIDIKQLDLIIVTNGRSLQNVDHIVAPKHCLHAGRYMFSHPSRCQSESKQP